MGGRKTLKSNTLRPAQSGEEERAQLGVRGEGDGNPLGTTIFSKKKKTKPSRSRVGLYKQEGKEGGGRHASGADLKRRKESEGWKGVSSRWPKLKCPDDTKKHSRFSWDGPRYSS